ncbi:nucleolin-like [Daphnia pulicaria]|uniref:nucleolin-like n=1 Tax=Daphnia pulicaria TaxID=35523 RepID=UPI001EEC58D5|nr:nucleolin-like [Daphnia pulicaria]
MSGGSNSNFLWILKSSLFFSTSKKLFASFAGHITSSASLQSLSGNKPNRCEYEQLSPVEGNNNRPSDRNKKSGKNKNDRHRRFGSIDNDGNNGNDDDSSSSSSQEDDEDSDEDDDDEEIDRLTCWVCERAFSSTRILERHKIRERHFGCGTCDAIFPTLMALEAHQEEADHWSSDDDEDDDDDKDVDGRRDLSEDSQLDTEDEMELDCKDRQLKKERLFLI